MRDGQRGQSLVMVAILLPVLLGMAALIIDLGYAYTSYQELLSATQAAALAGGAPFPMLPVPSRSTMAQQYSALKIGPTKELNYHANLQKCHNFDQYRLRQPILVSKSWDSPV